MRNTKGQRQDVILVGQVLFLADAVSLRFRVSGDDVRDQPWWARSGHLYLGRAELTAQDQARLRRWVITQLPR